MTRRRRKLTEAQWSTVFRLRCRTKSGNSISDDERRLIEAAWSEDPERYRQMNPDVFDATVPVGSNARAKR